MVSDPLPSPYAARYDRAALSACNCTHFVLTHFSTYWKKNSQESGSENGRSKTVTVAYADDVTVLLTSPANVQKLQDTLHVYVEATGARINTNPGLSQWESGTHQDR